MTETGLCLSGTSYVGLHPGFDSNTSKCPNASATWHLHLKGKCNKASPFSTSQHWSKQLPTPSNREPAWVRPPHQTLLHLWSPPAPAAFSMLAGKHTHQRLSPFSHSPSAEAGPRVKFCTPRWWDAQCTPHAAPHSTFPQPNLYIFLHKTIWQNHGPPFTCSWYGCTNLKIPFCE